MTENRAALFQRSAEFREAKGRNFEASGRDLGETPCTAGTKHHDVQLKLKLFAGQKK